LWKFCDAHEKIHLLSSLEMYFTLYRIRIDMILCTSRYIAVVEFALADENYRVS